MLQNGSALECKFMNISKLGECCKGLSASPGACYSVPSVKVSERTPLSDTILGIMLPISLRTSPLMSVGKNYLRQHWINESYQINKMGETDYKRKSYPCF